MAKQTIIKKWAEDTHNKYELSEEQIKTGIARLGNIVSNQLNAVANRADIMIDLLQRCSAWNVNKTYQQGDICMVSIYYKRPSDAQHKYYIMFLISTKNDNTEIPLINNGGTSFTRNDDLSTPCFTITANSEIILSNFVNGTGWAFADSTCGDLTNCVNLAVSDLAHFKGNTSFDGNVVANSNINLAGNLTTQGHLELAGTASFNNSVTLNGLVNTATTPAQNAVNNEIITAKWVRDFVGNTNLSQYPPYAYITDKIFELKELETTNIELTVPAAIFSFVNSFMFYIFTIDENERPIQQVYASKAGVIVDTNQFNYSYVSIAPEIKMEDYTPLPLFKNIEVIKEGYVELHYLTGYMYADFTGAHLQNGRWIDFKYAFQYGYPLIYNYNEGQIQNILPFYNVIIGGFTKNTEYGNAKYKIVLCFV